MRLITLADEPGKFQNGLLFLNLDKNKQKVIEHYVNTFLANIVHLMSLIDMVNYDPESLEMVKELSQILGYEFDQKISTLRQNAFHDYRSLQWL